MDRFSGLHISLGESITGPTLGLTQVKHGSHMRSASDSTSLCSTLFVSKLHLVSAIPNGLTVEYYRGSTDPMWGRMFKHTLEVADGHVSPPDRPGFGIELNDEALAPHRVG